MGRTAVCDKGEVACPVGIVWWAWVRVRMVMGVAVMGDVMGSDGKGLV